MHLVGIMGPLVSTRGVDAIPVVDPVSGWTVTNWKYNVFSCKIFYFQMKVSLVSPAF